MKPFFLPFLLTAGLILGSTTTGLSQWMQPVWDDSLDHWELREQDYDTVIASGFDEAYSLIRYASAGHKTSGWGAINLQGETFIPFQYDTIQAVEWGIFKARKGQVWHTYRADDDPTTKDGSLIKHEFQSFRLLPHIKKAFVGQTNEGKWGVVHSTGAIYVPFEYDTIVDFHNGVIKGRKDEAWHGYLADNNPKTEDGLLAEQDFLMFDVLGGLSNLCLAQNRGGKWGVLTTDRNAFIPFEYDTIIQLQNGVIAARKDSVWHPYVANADRATQGGLLSKHTFKSFTRLERTENTFVGETTDGQIKLFAVHWHKKHKRISSQNLLAPPKDFSEVHASEKLYLVQRKAGSGVRYGLIGRQGVPIIPFRFKAIHGQGRFHVVAHGRGNRKHVYYPGSKSKPSYGSARYLIPTPHNRWRRGYFKYKMKRKLPVTKTELRQKVYSSRFDSVQFLNGPFHCLYRREKEYIRLIHNQQTIRVRNWYQADRGYIVSQTRKGVRIGINSRGKRFRFTPKRVQKASTDQYEIQRLAMKHNRKELILQGFFNQDGKELVKPNAYFIIHRNQQWASIQELRGNVRKFGVIDLATGDTLAPLQFDAVEFRSGGTVKLTQGDREIWIDRHLDTLASPSSSSSALDTTACYPLPAYRFERLKQDYTRHWDWPQGQKELNYQNPPFSYKTYNPFLLRFEAAEPPIKNRVILAAKDSTGKDFQILADVHACPVVPHKFRGLRYLGHGLLQADTNLSTVPGPAQSYIMDANGKVLLPESRFQIHRTLDSSIIIQENGMWGLLGAEGRWLLQPEWHSMRWMQQGHVILSKADHHALATTGGHLLTDLIYTDIRLYSRKPRTFKAFKGEEFFILDEFGQSMSEEAIRKLK